VMMMVNSRYDIVHVYLCDDDDAGEFQV